MGGFTGSLQQTLSYPMTMVVKDPSQIGRNDSIATATPVSNLSLLASVSPYSDSQFTAPDADYYSVSAAPGTIVQVYVSANNDFLQPPEPNSMLPVIEIVDANGTRYQTCGYYGMLPGQVNNTVREPSSREPISVRQLLRVPSSWIRKYCRKVLRADF